MSARVKDRAGQTIESPCIDVCDTQGTNICRGCFRSIDDIMAWPHASDAQKRAILDRASARQTGAPD